MNTIGPPVCPRLPPNINVAHPPTHSLTCSAHPQRPACPAPEARGGRAGGTCSASTLNKGEAEGGGGLGLYDYLFRCWTKVVFNIRVLVPMSDEDHIQYTRICSDVGRRSYPIYECWFQCWTKIIFNIRVLVLRESLHAGPGGHS